VFHHFTHEFFSGSAVPRDTFLVRFDSAAQLFYPALLKQDVGLDAEAEVTSLSYAGESWFMQIREGSGEETETAYRAFSLYANIANPQRSQPVVREVSREAFRNTLQSESYALSAPPRLKDLLPRIPSDISFFIECLFQSAASPKRFSSGAASARSDDASSTVNTAEQIEVNGHAVLADTYAVAAFEDGTVYFQGALSEYPIYNNNAVTVFKLPALPANFVYGNCIVSGKNLYIAWEEKHFFETARSGFIEIHLDTLLYKEAR
jgi:hypothetical protein